MDILGKKTLRSLLADKVKQHEEKVFIHFEDGNEQHYKKTYKEFQEEVNKLSNAFLNLGLQEGNHVVLHLPNNIEFLSAWFALANIGAIMVPTNILSTADEMKYIINHSEAIVLMTEVEHLDKFNQIRKELPTIQHTIITRCEQAIEGVFNFNDLLESSSDNTEASERL